MPGRDLARGRPRGYRLLVALGGVALLLALATVVVGSKNRSLAKDVTARQSFINTSVRLSQVNTQLIQGLATLAARSGDREIEQLLASQGISFKTTSDGGGGE